jgi:hypothetical protein
MRRFVVVVVLLAWIAPAAADKAVETWPKVVTRGWLGELGKGKWPLAKLVDPDRGLVVIEHLVDSANAEYVQIRTATRLCGEQLDPALPELQSRVLAELAHSDTAECHNRPGPAECHFAFANEYTTRTVLMFRPRASGDLALDAILFVDGGSIGESSVLAQQKFVESKYAALRRTDCAGKPDTPASVAGIKY